MEGVTDNNPMLNQMLDLQPKREPENTPQVPVVPQQVEEQPTENVPEAPSAGKFGWTSQDETLSSLPFVSRDSERFIAKRICESEILNCLHPNAITAEYFDIYRMTSSEAMTFNEVNIEHCDKGLVGDYTFKAGDILFNLKDISTYIKFLLAFKNAVKYKKMRNDVFGFVKFSGQNNTVPFVWSEGKQMMPTFYFDGVEELLKEKCIYLTDKWKCLYLKVCFILQKVRSDLYNPKSIQVVDVLELKPLFPSNTTCTLSWPEDGYKDQNFVTIVERHEPSPEAMLAAMHGMTEPPILSPLINQNQKENTPDLISSLPATTAVPSMTEPPQIPLINQNRQENRSDVISRFPSDAQRSNMYNPFIFFPIPKPSSATFQMPSNNPPMRSLPFTCTDPYCRACLSKPNAVANTFYPCPASPVSTSTNQIPAGNNSHSINNSNSRRRRKIIAKTWNNFTFKRPIQPMPAEVPQHKPTTSSTNRLSNVPYASPQSASSPEMHFPSPVISGASVGHMSGNPQTLGHTNDHLRNDPWARTYICEPMRTDPRTASSRNNDVQNQRGNRLPAFYSSYHQFASTMQQQANINVNRVASSNTPLPQTVIESSAGYNSAGYNNGTGSQGNLPQNVIVSAAGFYSAGYNIGTVSSSSSASYNNVFGNASLTQSVVVNSGGYYMPVNADPVYLPGSVTSSRTTGASGRMDTLF